MNKEIIDYIKKCRDIGQTDEQIKEALVMAGHKIEISDIKNLKITNPASSQPLKPNLWRDVSNNNINSSLRQSFILFASYFVIGLALPFLLYILLYAFVPVIIMFIVSAFPSLESSLADSHFIGLLGLVSFIGIAAVSLANRKYKIGYFLIELLLVLVLFVSLYEVFNIFKNFDSSAGIIILLVILAIHFLVVFRIVINVYNAKKQELSLKSATLKVLLWDWPPLVRIIIINYIVVISIALIGSLISIGMNTLNTPKSESLQSSQNMAVNEKTSIVSIDPIRPILVRNLSNIQEINNLGFSTSGFYTSYDGVTIEDWKEGDIFTIYPNTPYFKDRDRVHYGIKILEGVDSDSFVVYDNSFAKDKNRIYLSGMAEYPQSLDVNTFEKINNKYFKDKNSVYFSSIVWDKKFGQSSYYKLDPMSGLDVDSFKPIGINERFYMDKNGIYFESYNTSSSGEDVVSLDKIIEADKNTFQIIGLCGFKGAFSYAKDKNYVYNGVNIVGGVDVSTFELVGDYSEGAGIYCFTKDKNCIYNSNQKVLDTNGLCVNPIACTKDTVASGCGF